MKSVAVFLLLLGFCVVAYGAIMLAAHKPQENVKPRQVAQKAQRIRYNRDIAKKRSTDVKLMVAGVIIMVAGGVVYFIPKKKGTTVA